MKRSLDIIDSEPMDDAEIRKIIPDIKIIKYADFNKYNNILDVLPAEGDQLIYLLENSPNDGHWMALKRLNNEILHFDPYGNHIDADLKWISKAENSKLSQTNNRLSNILSGSGLLTKYNNIDYQNHASDIATCGRHCCLFLLSNLSLENYYKKMKELKKINKMNYDDIVCSIISI